MKQAFSLWAFSGKGVDDKTLMLKAKAIGYDAVDLVPPKLFQLVHDCGLAISLATGAGGLESGLNDPARHDAIVKEIEGNLAQAVKFHIPNLVVFNGNRRPGLSEQQGADYCITGLRRVAKSAEDAGVTLVMELLNSKVNHPGHQCDHTDWAVKVIQGVGSLRVKILYDIYHMQIMEGDLIRTIRANATHIGHYHTGGNPGRNDLDDQQEINHPPIVRAIAQTGYQGYIAHEFIPKGEPVAALKAAYDVVANA